MLLELSYYIYFSSIVALCLYLSLYCFSPIFLPFLCLFFSIFPSVRPSHTILHCCVFSVWSPGSSHTPSGLLLLLSPSHEALTWLLVIYPSCVPHTLSPSQSLSFFLSHTQDRDINTSQNVLNMWFFLSWDFHFSAPVLYIFLELLSLQSGSINSKQWIGSYSSSSSCLRSSVAGSLAQWVCILNAPLASMREMIGRINCGWRAEWE